jgi:hypothetical protein
MLYNATKSEKYVLRVTVQHRRIQMEKLTLEQVKTLVWVAVLDETDYENLPLGEKIAKLDYTSFDIEMEDYVESLEYFSKIGIFKPEDKDTAYVQLESQYLDGPTDLIPCYELTEKGKLVTKAVLKKLAEYEDEEIKDKINRTIDIINFVKNKWMDIVEIIIAILK